MALNTTKQLPDHADIAAAKVVGYISAKWGIITDTTAMTEIAKIIRSSGPVSSTPAPGMDKPIDLARW